MNYEQYLELQTRVEWLFDFHPNFFDFDLSETERVALKELLLIGVSDEEYPASIADYYESRIAGKPDEVRRIVQAVEHLYEVSRSGSVCDSFPSLRRYL